jgi:hypothetical protein
MAKKFDTILGRISFSLLLVVTLFSVMNIALPLVEAQGQVPREGDIVGSIPEECTIRRDFSAGGVDFNKGDTVGPLGSGSTLTHSRDDWGIICFLNAVYYVTDWVFYILMLAVMIMILIGGFLFLTAGGSTDKVSKAGKVIAFSIVGLLIGLLARVIPSIVKYVSGIG